jgi:hypothetical protein
MKNFDLVVRKNLSLIIDELAGQHEVGRSYEDSKMAYEDEIKALREYVDTAHEYSVAYESIIATLEKHKFLLSGPLGCALTGTRVDYALQDRTKRGLRF